MCQPTNNKASISKPINSQRPSSTDIASRERVGSMQTLGKAGVTGPCFALLYYGGLSVVNRQIKPIFLHVLMLSWSKCILSCFCFCLSTWGAVGGKTGREGHREERGREIGKIQVDDAPGWRQEEIANALETSGETWRHDNTLSAFCQVLSCFCEGSLAGCLESEGLQIFVRFRWFVQFEKNWRKCLDGVQTPRSSEVKSTENGNALYLPWLIQSLGREPSTQNSQQVRR